MSCGTRRPNRWRPASSPFACWSEVTNTAVASGASLTSRSAAAHPPSADQGTRTTGPGVSPDLVSASFQARSLTSDCSDPVTSAIRRWRWVSTRWRTAFSDPP